MQRPPQLADPAALAARRARATPQGGFLRDAVRDDVQERLKEVNRSFTRPAVVTGFPGGWAARLPSAVIVPDAEVLALEPGAHDLVIHDLCLPWASDPVGQLVQARRALEPDGMLLATLFGGQTLHELRSTLAEAEARVTGGLSPRVAPMAEIRDMGALLQRAGLALPVADATPFDVSYPDAYALMRDLRAMGEGNALAGRVRHFTRRAVLDDAARLYAEHFGAEDRVPATFEVLTLTGWAPAESQPKPLRPGSATTRLADVLGTTETPLDQSDE